VQVLNHTVSLSPLRPTLCVDFGSLPRIQWSIMIHDEALTDRADCSLQRRTLHGKLDENLLLQNCQMLWIIQNLRTL